MSRKCKECEDGDSAWEIALADLMTTLMVFFLVMWLISIVSPEKRKEFVNAVVGDASSGQDVVPLDSGAVTQMNVIKPIVEQPPVTPQEIQKALKNVDPKDISIEETKDFTKITLRSDSFFESGRATIKDKIREQLEHLGETLANRNQAILVVGYTDNVPISNFQFPSNWELSAARAATIARTFIYMGVPKKLVKIEGCADNDPVAPNKSAYGRSLNRRVVILVSKHPQKDPLKEQVTSP